MNKTIVVDKTENNPQSKQIENQIIEALKSGELKPLDLLPGERTLAVQAKVTRDVVRNAYHNLEKLGFIKVLGEAGRQVSPDALEHIGYYLRENNRSAK